MGLKGETKITSSEQQLSCFFTAKSFKYPPLVSNPDLRQPSVESGNEINLPQHRDMYHVYIYFRQQILQIVIQNDTLWCKLRV